MDVDIGHALDIPGFMQPEELEWLAQQARPCARIVEIGSWKGRSTRALADHCAGAVYVVDAWLPSAEASDLAGDALLWYGGQAIFRAWADGLRDLLDAGRIRYMPMRSERAVRFLEVYPGTGSIDFVFIDGDHSREGCEADIRAYLPLVKPGGLIGGHDYTDARHPGVRDAVDAVFGDRVERGPASIWFERCPCES